MIQKNYEELTHFLEQIPQFTEKNGLERATGLLKAMGNPENNFKVIHVAGSNGKGSVCAYLNEILIENGYRTGMFISPHLVDIRERIRMDNQFISREELTEAFGQVYNLVPQLEAQGIHLAYFDYFFGMAMYYFAKKNVDIVILETGIGGKLDATNAIQAPVLSVITTVSLEHMGVLGSTLEEIAQEKAGIIKSGVSVVYSAKNSSVSKIIEETARQRKASLTEGVYQKDYQIDKNTGNRIDFSLHNGYYKNDCFSLATGAVYQAENCSLALTAAKVLQNCGQIRLDEGKVKQAVYNTHWEGRMEEVLPGVFLDGAHNPEGIEGFIESAKAICGKRSATLLFSVVKDKNFEKMIHSLSVSGIFDSFAVTGLHSARKLDEDSIKELFQQYTQVPVYEFNCVSEAFQWGLAKQKESPGRVLMCTGSLYLVGEIKTMIANWE